MLRSILFIIFFQVVLHFSSFSQSVYTNPNLLILKAGKGINYGGYGINFEFRSYHFGNSISSGYINPYYYDTVKISGSFNLAFSTNFYFLDARSSLKPFVGLHLGWLNNYYNDKIGNQSYNPFVYGAAMKYGIEFTEDIMHFSFCFNVDPGFAITKGKAHPYYKDQVHFSTSFGFGLNLLALSSNKDKHKGENLNSSEHLNGIVFNDQNTKPADDNTADNISTFKNTIEEKCFNYSNHPLMQSISKGSCGDLLVYQQIGMDKFILVRIDEYISELQNAQLAFSLDSINNKAVKIYLVNTTSFNKSNCEEVLKKLDTDNNLYTAIEGKIKLVINEIDNENSDFSSAISLLISSIKFQRKSESLKEELYFDEILICKISY